MNKGWILLLFIKGNRFQIPPPLFFAKRKSVLADSLLRPFCSIGNFDLLPNHPPWFVPKFSKGGSHACTFLGSWVYANYNFFKVWCKVWSKSLLDQVLNPPSTRNFCSLKFCFFLALDHLLLFKNCQQLLLITFYIFWKIFCPKKISAKLSFFQIRSFCFPHMRITLQTPPPR